MKNRPDSGPEDPGYSEKSEVLEKFNSNIPATHSLASTKRVSHSRGGNQMGSRSVLVAVVLALLLLCPLASCTTYPLYKTVLMPRISSPIINANSIGAQIARIIQVGGASVAVILENQASDKITILDPAATTKLQQLTSSGLTTVDGMVSHTMSTVLLLTKSSTGSATWADISVSSGTYSATYTALGVSCQKAAAIYGSAGKFICATTAGIVKVNKATNAADGGVASHSTTGAAGGQVMDVTPSGTLLFLAYKATDNKVYQYVVGAAGVAPTSQVSFTLTASGFNGVSALVADNISGNYKAYLVYKINSVVRLATLVSNPSSSYAITSESDIALTLTTAASFISNFGTSNSMIAVNHQGSRFIDLYSKSTSGSASSLLKQIEMSPQSAETVATQDILIEEISGLLYYPWMNFYGWNIYNLNLCTCIWDTGSSTCLSCGPSCYRSADAKDCMKQVNFPSKYGIDTAGSADQIAACPANCLTCTLDKSKCTACDFTNGYYLHPTLFTCHSRSTIPATHGIKLTGSTPPTNPTLSVCKTGFNCKTCTYDADHCDSCDDTTGFYLLISPTVPATDRSCLTTSTVPAGYGLFAAAKTFVACNSAKNCLTCPQNSERCSTCAAGTFVQDDVFSCVSMTAGLGFKFFTVDSAVRVAPCDPNSLCLSCSTGGPYDALTNNYQRCTSCATNFNIYPDSGKCIDRRADSLSNAGLGLDLTASGPLDAKPWKLCDPNKHCKTCRQDYLNCESCDITSALYKYLYTSGGVTSCQLNTGGRGLALSSPNSGQIIQDCDSTKNCQTCDDNYNSCKTCASTRSLFADTTTGLSSCVISNTNHADNTGKGKDPAVTLVSTLRYCKPSAHCATCLTKYTECENCPTNYNLDPTLKICIYRLKDNYDNIRKGIDLAGGVADDSKQWAPCDPLRNCRTCRLDKNNCDSCNVAGTYKYLYTASSITSCIAAVAGKGKALTSGLMVLKDCFDTNCATCEDDYNVCKTCKANYALYRTSLGATSCIISNVVHTSNAMKGLDPLAGTPTLKDCLPSQNCASCLADFNRCTTCPNNYNYNAANYKCIYRLEENPDNLGLGLDIPSGGAVDNTRLWVGCTTGNNCRSCRLNKDICDSCDLTTASKRYRFVSGTSVICTSNTIGKGLAIDTDGSQIVKSCDPSLNCLTCDDNWQSCKTCASGRGLYTSVMTGATSCILSSGAGVTENKGKGVDLSIPTPTTMKDCLPSMNCDTCLTDYTKCQTCPPGYNFYPTTSKCILRNTDNADNIGKGLDMTGGGPVSDTQQWTLCNTANNCKTCRLDKDKCDSCDMTTNYKYLYTSGSTVSCVQNNLGKGLDKDPSEDKSQAFVSPASLCATCDSQYKNCLTCNAGTALYTNPAGLTTCITTIGNDPTNYGLGKDLTAGTPTLKACSPIMRCTKCLSDYTKCTECQTGFNLYSVSGMCMPRAFDNEYNVGVGLDRTGGLPADDNRVFVACNTANNCRSCRMNKDKCESCIMTSANKYLYDDGTTVICSPNTLGKGLAADANGGQIVNTCQTSSSCATCDDKFVNCKTCNANYALWTDSNGLTTCIISNVDHATNTGKGLDTAAGSTKFKPCDPTKFCATCLTDYTRCATCQTNYNLFVAGNRCLNRNADDGDNKGKGLDMTGSMAIALRQFVLCNSANNCKTCRNDKEKCESCDTSTANKYLYDSGTTVICTSNTAGKGLAQLGDGTQVVKLCDPASNCATCDNHFQNCKTCATGRALWTDSNGLTTCLSTAAPDAFNSGKGLDTLAGTATLKLCDPDSRCATCLSDYTKCVTCLTGFNLYSTTSKCLDRNFDNPANIGIGLDLTGGLPANDARVFVPCDPAKNCKTCRPNKDSCTSCDVTSTFKYLYNDGTTVSCIVNDNGKGLTLDPNGAQIAEPCLATSNCLTCDDNKAICKTCPANRGLYLDPTTGITTCILKDIQDTTNDGKGLDLTIAIPTLKLCDPTKFCSKCLADYTKCTACLPNNNMLVAESRCFSRTADNVDNFGRGLDLAGGSADDTKLWVPCNTAKNCRTCRNNKDRCESCDVTSASNKYLYDDGTNKYCTMNTLGKGLKFDPTQGQILSLCLGSSSCATCDDNYMNCKTCATNFFLYKNPSGTTVCIDASGPLLVNKGLGKYTSGGVTILRECNLGANCDTCLNNYLLCQTCKTGFNLYAATSQCISRAADNIENVGKGLDLQGGAVSDAKNFLDCESTKNCLTCRLNKDKCDTCNTALGYYLYPATSTCIESNVDSIANKGLGLKQLPGTGGVVFEPCATGYGCATCLENYKRCKTCTDPTYQIDPYDEKCKAPAQVALFVPVSTDAKGIGLDPITSKQRECQTSLNCKTCEDNYKKCTTCYEGYYLENYVCLLEKVKVVPSTPSDKSMAVLLNINVQNVNLDTLTITIIDKTKGEKYVCPPSECKAMPNKNNNNAIQFELKPNFESLYAQVVVKRTTTTSTTTSRVLADASTLDPFANEFVLDDLQFTKPNGQNEGYFTVFVIINAMRLFSSYGFAGLNSNRVFFVTDIFSTLFYLSLVEGPLVSHAERSIGLHTYWHLLVINFGNPFSSWNEFCLADTKYPKKKLFCNFLKNYGQNWIILMCTLAVSLALYFLYKHLLKNKNNQAKSLTAFSEPSADASKHSVLPPSKSLPTSESSPL